MKVLIAGGAGFIGSHLVDKLIAEEIPISDRILIKIEDNAKYFAPNYRKTLEDLYKWMKEWKYNHYFT